MYTYFYMYYVMYFVFFISNDSFIFIVPNNKYKLHHDGLLIKRVARNNTGEYTCKAFQISDALSNVDEQTIRLNVQRKFFVEILILKIISCNNLI